MAKPRGAFVMGCNSPLATPRAISTSRSLQIKHVCVGILRSNVDEYFIWQWLIWFIPHYQTFFLRTKHTLMFKSPISSVERIHIIRRNTNSEPLPKRSHNLHSVNHIVERTYSLDIIFESSEKTMSSDKSHTIDTREIITSR